MVVLFGRRYVAVLYVSDFNFIPSCLVQFVNC